MLERQGDGLCEQTRGSKRQSFEKEKWDLFRVMRPVIVVSRTSMIGSHLSLAIVARRELCAV